MKRQIIFAIAAILLPAWAGAIDVRTKGELMASQDISADVLLKQADSLFKEKKYPEALAAYQITLDTAGEEQAGRPSCLSLTAGTMLW